MSKHRHHRVSTRHEPVTVEELQERKQRIHDLYWRGEIDRESASRNTAKIDKRIAALAIWEQAQNG